VGKDTCYPKDQSNKHLIWKEGGILLSTTLLATIFVIGLLVFFHELGHFITAKSVGMRVDEFAIGFGPKLLSKRYGETVYSLRAFPLGGFNKIAGMDSEEEQDEYSFNTKPIWARILVIISGPLMNFVLAVLLLGIVYVGYGIETDVAIVGTIMPGKPAFHAGLAEGDQILSIDGIKVESWRQFVSMIQISADQPLAITYKRGEQTSTVTVKPEFDQQAKRALIGVTKKVTLQRQSLGEAIVLSVQQVYTLSGGMLSGIGQMIFGQAPADLVGPVGVAQMAGEVAQLGIFPLLHFAAILSINLGLLNLLPIPALDGGHVVTLTVEALRGKPLSPQKAQFIQLIGFSLLMIILLLTTFKDIARLKVF